MKEIIIGREGNQAVAITDRTVSRRHCKLTVNPDGSMILENLSGSGTKVDGIEIIRKAVRPDSIVQLGPQFRMRICDLVGHVSSTGQSTGTASAAAPKPGQKQPEPPEVNISHLRRVWEEYNSTNLMIATEQRKINLIRAALGIATMCTLPLMYILGPEALIITGVAIVGNIYSFVGIKNAETPQQRQERQDDFDALWVCPNPRCHRSIISKNYKLLVRNYQSCPWCKAKYVEL